jgi:hypothetical protein
MSMSEQLDREPVGTEQDPAGEPYSPPRLVRHGTVEDLTAGGPSPLLGDGISGSIP